MRKTIALIAHDKKKLDLALFALEHRETLKRFDLIATGTTGSILESKTGLRAATSK